VAGAALTGAGHAVTWVGALEVTPTPTQETPALVIVDGDAPGMDLGLLTASWRRREPAPTLLVLCTSSAARASAERVRAVAAAWPATGDELVAHATRVLGRADDRALTPVAALTALGLPGGGRPEDEAAAIVAGARTIAIDHVREALRPHMYDYAQATALVEVLGTRRVLAGVEARVARQLDGGRTIRRVIDGVAADLPAHSAARLLWGLIAGGAVILAAEPPPAHPTARLRAHLRARAARLAGANLYAVMEVGLEAMPIDVERAALLLELRYGPEAGSRHDLGDLAAAAEANWAQIRQARQVLSDPRLRGMYDASLFRTADDLEQTRLRRRMYSDEAERYFVRGQHALAAGDIFRAVSELAAAARRVIDQPDYEVYTAWARFLADEQRGVFRPPPVGARAAAAADERTARAHRERATAERALLGRRPWPRALFVVGLLAEASGDVASAVSYFREAVHSDEKLVAARQALARLGAAM
jgi:hypothetical protein